MHTDWLDFQIVVRLFNNGYLEFANQQANILNRVADILDNKFSDLFPTQMLREVGDDIYLLALDKVFGYAEIIKAKFKHIVETLALEMYMNKNVYPWIIDLNRYNTHLRMLQVLDPEKYEEKSRFYYKKIKKKTNIDYETFVSKTSKMLGFVDNFESINKFVYSFIEACLVSNPEYIAHIKMLYDESQALSHANGYMIGANNGAFGEYSLVLYFIDLAQKVILNLIIAHIKLLPYLYPNLNIDNPLKEIMSLSKDYEEKMKSKHILDKISEKYKIKI